MSVGDRALALLWSSSAWARHQTSASRAAGEIAPVHLYSDNVVIKLINDLGKQGIEVESLDWDEGGWVTFHFNSASDLTAARMLI